MLFVTFVMYYGGDIPYFVRSVMLSGGDITYFVRSVIITEVKYFILYCSVMHYGA